MAAVEKFIEHIELLLNGTEVDLYDSIDSSFEYIAGALLGKLRDNGIWYDGTGDLTFKKRKLNQLDFSGNMHVMNEQKECWKEPFFARVTDKRCTKQGVIVFVRIGEYEAEGELIELFT
ncbi:MAG: hypothetical protein OQJ89_10540 [Kangiellaceae bacterium]|nr:hypothetical protein [Kangiellaceae bacterium]